ncbi:MAG: PH domain-containing protein [Anaerolineae bacterium]|nr:PH domain-containing protein [Anaerolineae bacterium]
MLDTSTSAIQQELSPGERLLWSGQPRKGVVFRSMDIFLVPFSLLWGGFACFWETMALTNGISFLTLWGIPFVLVGLYMIGGRFIFDARQREGTYYGVTNERIIIASGLFNRKIKSLNLRTLTDLTLNQKADGSGSITFGPVPPMAWWYEGMYWPGQQIPPSFQMIPDAKQVYNLIVETQRQAR